MRTLGGACRVVTALIVGAALAACTAQPLPVLPGNGPVSSSVAPLLPREIVLGVDQLVSGFNPHTLADLTPVSQAVAGLLLPSAFRQTPAGQWVLDDTLLNSAEVTDTAPFTITYRIRRNAQWSDVTPIAAEDFGYLAEQMRTQPG
ncbi:MAG: ABC transporter family substrate-binding protein, partial [Pseudonocardiaceae bacterium]